MESWTAAVAHATATTAALRSLLDPRLRPQLLIGAHNRRNNFHVNACLSLEQI